MEKITILDTDHVNVWYYPDKKIMHTEFKKYTYGKDYREFLDTVANSILKYKSQKLLSDDRNNQGIAKEDKEWGKKEWFPRAKSVGWRYWAVVLPENAIGKLTMKNVVNDVISEGVTTELFTDPYLAMAWLEKQK